jgi:low temperature requirement protein LtrA
VICGFWLAALAFDLVAAAVGGRRDMWPIAAGHFAERHGLIVIIALGESLVAAGVAGSEVARSATFAVTTAGAVAGTCALWWTYFGTLQPMLERRLADQAVVDRGNFARDAYSLWHASVVAGVVGVAVAFEEAVAHPDDMLSLEAALAMTLGAAMFLGGVAGAAWQSGLRSQSAVRLTACAIVLAATPVVSQVPAYVALWGLALLVIAIDIFDWRRSTRDSTTTGRSGGG